MSPLNSVTISERPSFCFGMPIPAQKAFGALRFSRRYTFYVIFEKLTVLKSLSDCSKHSVSNVPKMWLFVHNGSATYLRRKHRATKFHSESTRRAGPGRSSFDGLACSTTVVFGIELVWNTNRYKLSLPDDKRKVIDFRFRKTRRRRIIRLTHCCTKSQYV